MRKSKKWFTLGIAGVVGVAAASVAMAFGNSGDTGFFPLPPQPNGACITGNTCQVMPGTFCHVLGGEFLGPGTQCP